MQTTTAQGVLLKWIATGACLFAVSMLGPALVASSRGEEQREWVPVFEETFSDSSYSKHWTLEGAADLALAREADTDFLKIRTQPGKPNSKWGYSVLWCRERFDGDVKFVFRAKGQPSNRSIVFFNANPTKSSGRKSIFDWTRPDADYSRYAGDDRIELYSLGILRDDQQKCNLRYLGGATASLLKASDKAARDLFQRETIMHTCESPFRGKPDRWFMFELTVVQGTITLNLDGDQVFHIHDTGNTGGPEFSWKPLDDGGFFAFRNFRPNTVSIDYFKVYRPRKQQAADSADARRSTSKRRESR